MMNEKSDRKWLNKMADAEDKVVGGLSAGGMINEKLSTWLRDSVSMGELPDTDEMADAIFTAEALESSLAQAQADVEALQAVRSQAQNVVNEEFHGWELGGGYIQLHKLEESLDALPEHLMGAARNG